MREGDRREGDPSTSDAIVFQASIMEILQVGHVADKEISKLKFSFTITANNPLTPKI